MKAAIEELEATLPVRIMEEAGGKVARGDEEKEKPKAPKTMNNKETGLNSF